MEDVAPLKPIQLFRKHHKRQLTGSEGDVFCTCCPSHPIFHHVVSLPVPCTCCRGQAGHSRTRGVLFEYKKLLK